ncbi:MAG: D-glycero-beta-D-manno-heptose-7-phosphate kinase [Acidiferrobacteraceae bacterium]|nr:D-glycero-beta-D-manno-heptose-7-phosphate kinase [Acidiferrobacteraceae bacterium]|tara:strand:- start:784 stop:1770 length:987 start_codon:yes stop_codon:yes gene_type:complete
MSMTYSKLSWKDLDEELFSQLEVLVVGDVMLDRYWLGEVQRISPEAPVPIVSVDSSQTRVGGAGNVAANIRAFGAKCSLITAIGDDDIGREVEQILAGHDVRHYLEVDAGTRTTEKLRIISRNQQLLRADFESNFTREVVDRCFQSFLELLPSINIVVISDYGKGSLGHIERMIEMATTYGVPTIIDPKGNDFTRYTGATVVTPNELELRNVVGAWGSDEEMESKSLELIRDLGISGLLVTRGSDGMRLYQPNKSTINQDATSFEIYDVSGAGDTVVAMVSVGIAVGLDWHKILNLANIAAGVAVQKLGTAVATRAEIQSASEAEQIT